MKTQRLSKSTALLVTWSLVQPGVPMAFADMDPLKLSAGQINTNALPGERVNLDQLCDHFLNLPKDNALHKGKPLKAQCEAFTWTEDAELQTKCKLRQVAMNSQAQAYCQARKSSQFAIKSLKSAIALDATAAGVCLAEAYAPFPMPPMCGYAALGAGAWEMIRVTKLMIGSKKLGSTNDKGKGEATLSGGNYKVDAEGNVSRKDVATPGVTHLATTLAPLALGVVWGTKYVAQSCDTEKARAMSGPNVPLAPSTPLSDRQICEATHSPALSGGNREIARSTKRGSGLAPAQMLTLTSQGASERQAQVQKCMERRARQARADSDAITQKGAEAEKACIANKKALAGRIGVLFLGLAAMRAVNWTSAGKTKQAVEDSLRGITGENGQSAAGAITNNGNLGIGKSPAEFNSSASTFAAITSQDLDQDSPEAVMLKNSSLGSTAEDVANKMGLGNDKKFEEAMNSGGPAGIAANVAGALGVSKDAVLAAISEANPYIAQVDTSGSTYGMGGGGGSSAGSAASSATPLDFGKLLGGEESGGGMSAGVTEEAFRAPAKAKSIFHEDTDQNLFQIVSGRLENLQNQARIPAHIVR